MPDPIRTKRREPTSQMKLRSRRTSAPHASRATRAHDRPPRLFAARPSRTPTATLSMVTTSIPPSATVATAYWPDATARAPSEAGDVAEDLEQPDEGRSET